MSRIDGPSPHNPLYNHHHRVGGAPTPPKIPDNQNAPGQGVADAVNAYASQTEQWIQALEGNGTISKFQGDQLIADVNKQRALISGAKTNHDLLQIVNAVQKDANPPKLTPDEKQANQLLQQAENRETAWETLANQLIAKFKGYAARIQSDEALIARLTKDESKSSNPTKLKAALAQCTSNLATLKTKTAGLQKQITAIQTRMEGKQARLKDIKAMYATIFANPSSAKNDQTLAAMQRMIRNKFPIPGHGALSGWVSIEKPIDALFKTTENTLVTARKDYLPNDQPPALPKGQFYLEVNEISRIFASKNSATALSAYIAKLQGAGINTLDICFAQLDDATNLAKGGDAGDEIGNWIHANPDQFKSLQSAMKKAGMNIDISFGGGASSSTGWEIPGGDATGLANGLAQFMTDNNISAVDFDVEASLLVGKNTPQMMRTFFQTLHTKLQGTGKTMVLTSLAGPVNNITPVPDSKGNLPPIPKGGTPFPKNMGGFTWFLFFDDNQKHCFNSMFDGLNLMSYSQTNFFLSAPAPGWQGMADINTYLNLLGGGNAAASKLHFGFEDNVPYNGAKTAPNPAENGLYAAQAYEKLILALRAEGITNLGGPFFWPDSGLLPNQGPGTGIPNLSFEQSFNTELQRWNELNGDSSSSSIGSPGVESLDLAPDSWGDDLSPPTHHHKG